MTVLMVTSDENGQIVPWLFDSKVQAGRALSAFQAAGIQPQVFTSELWNEAPEVRHALHVWREQGTLDAYRGADVRVLLPVYRRLARGLAEAVRNGRIGPGELPEDFEWLADALSRVRSLDRALDKQVGSEEGAASAMPTLSRKVG